MQHQTLRFAQGERVLRCDRVVRITTVNFADQSHSHLDQRAPPITVRPERSEGSDPALNPASNASLRSGRTDVALQTAWRAKQRSDPLDVWRRRLNAAIGRTPRANVVIYPLPMIVTVMLASGLPPTTVRQVESSPLPLMRPVAKFLQKVPRRRMHVWRRFGAHCVD